MNTEEYFLIPCSAEASTSSVLEGEFCRLLESTGRVHPFTVRQSRVYVTNFTFLTSGMAAPGTGLTVVTESNMFIEEPG